MEIGGEGGGGQKGVMDVYITSILVVHLLSANVST